MNTLGTRGGRLATSWQFFVASLKFFRHNLDLVWLPVLSMVVTVVFFIVFAAGAVGVFFAEGSNVSAQSPMPIVGGAIVAFLFYLVVSFIVIFFNAVLLSCVIARLKGEKGLKSEGFKSVAHRWPQLLGWSLVSATVGMIVHALESAHNIIADIIGLVLGGAWSIGAYFGLPILVVEGVGPFKALKSGFKLFGQGWRKAVFVNIFLVLPFLMVWVVLFQLGKFLPALEGEMLMIGVIVFLLCLLLMSTVGSAISCIVRSALFLNFYQKQAVPGFDHALMQSAIVERRRRLF